MRSSKVKIKRNLAIPGEPMFQGEFANLIKEAEKGPFFSLEEVIGKMEVWKKSLKK
ncbi:MAG: hypothetical protein H7141_12845 [Burkholderiales bacterium]|nr:hypothetical protein [Bacteroidia bacterium]